MKVYIIGAGPGDPDLITVKGAKLVERCPVVFYTGSLVPREVIARARDDAKVYDSSGMDLDQITTILKEAFEKDQDVARVHTGDPSIFGSTAEQIRRMKALGIPYEIIPGVSSFTAAAAVLGKELTLPELTQTMIVTRVEGRTPMPEREKLSALGEHRATMVLFLSVAHIRKVVKELTPHYGGDCPVAVVQKATWPDQKIVLGTLQDIADKVKAAGITETAIILVGRVLTSSDFANSRLYDPEFTHRFRKGKATEAP
jgi:precorrin-4/cobalt-precorrin-4 C11-methyltransferase